MGGTERQAVLLANAYAAAGHETSLLTFRPGGRLTADVSPPVRHVILQTRDRGLDWWAPGLTATLQTLRPQIVQLMGRTAQILGWRLPQALPQSRFVATFRTGKTIPWLHRLTLRRAHAIVANCEEARRRLAARHGVRGPQVHVIYNAVAAPTAAPAGSRALVRQELDTAENSIVFLCTAMFRAEKGHRELIEMAARLDLDVPWALWLAGEGPELATCQELARSLGIADRVRFLGLRQDVARVYAAADVAVLASRRESLPNFLVEAQWLGLPIVAMDTAGVGETFAPDVSGRLIRAGDVGGFCAAMQELAHDPALRTRMANAARTHAAREFDPERQNERYLALFRALTDATGGSAP